MGYLGNAAVAAAAAAADLIFIPSAVRRGIFVLARMRGRPSFVQLANSTHPSIHPIHLSKRRPRLIRVLNLIVSPDCVCLQSQWSAAPGEGARCAATRSGAREAGEARGARELQWREQRWRQIK